MAFHDGVPAEPSVVLGDDERLGAPVAGHALPAHVVVARVARQSVRVVVVVRVAARGARRARERDRSPAKRNGPFCNPVFCGTADRSLMRLFTTKSFFSISLTCFAARPSDS